MNPTSPISPSTQEILHHLATSFFFFRVYKLTIHPFWPVALLGIVPLIVLEVLVLTKRNFIRFAFAKDEGPLHGALKRPTAYAPPPNLRAEYLLLLATIL